MNLLSRSEIDPRSVAGLDHVRRHWRAMATRFDVELVGPDAEHLEAVAAAIEDEVHRLDALLSRHNPASEISRLNRQAAATAQRVDADVWQLLQVAEVYRQATAGFFDVTATSASKAAGSANDQNAPRLVLDAARQTVRFSQAETAIDLGGIGKGFALDRAKEILAQYGVDAALLSAGSSSILAVGPPAPGAVGMTDAVWIVDLRHPADDRAEPIARLELVDQSLSCSSAVRPGESVSDIVDPHRGLPLSGGDAVVVLAAEGVAAEALSTALLAMGRGRATQYLAGTAWNKLNVTAVAWIDGFSPAPNLEWLFRSHD
jgi:thiamine biosynthesis lipoprotein